MIGVVLTALLFAFGVRRLLGLRLPLPRALLAGVIAYLLVSPITNAIAGSAGTKGPSILPMLWFVILGVAIAFVVGMAFLAGLSGLADLPT